MSTAVLNHLDNKRDNLRRAMEAMSPQRPNGTVENKPLLLHLEITSRCNLRCAKCGHATDPADSPRIQPRNLPYPIVETFDEQFAAAVRVHTFGYGEMFLYNKLKRLVERLKHYECTVDGITNGVLVDKEEVDWLVEYGYDELTFSIDGVKAETMRRLRGVDVEKIWRALAYFKQRKQETGKDRPRIIVNFVAQADNYDELPDLVTRLSEYNIFFLGVNPLMPAEPSHNPEEPYNKLWRQFGLENVPREKLEAALEDARQRAAQAGIGYYAYIDLDALYGHGYGWSHGDKLLQIVPDQQLETVQQNHELQPYYCSYPWTSLYVHADAGARVCCYMDGTLGKIESGADFTRVWTEGTINDIREAIRNGDVHPQCMSCVGLGRYQHSHIELTEIQKALA